jgi:hypothetical protein
LLDELNKFSKIKELMLRIAKEKKSYHKVIINSILNRYSDPEEFKILIQQRLEDFHITTHMSLKRALKKNKDGSRSVVQVQNDRPRLTIGISSLAHENVEPSDSEEE